MRVVVQRVKKASVEVGNSVVSFIDHGMVILLGIEVNDNENDIDWTTKKLSQLRIFDDESRIMNKSLVDVKGDVIVISQFTLHALTKKGNRPSYIKSASHQTAIPLYEYFIKMFKEKMNDRVKSGVFGADMKVNLLNDGPVTIIIDTKDKE